MRNQPAVTRHRFEPGSGDTDCAHCPAPERNRRYHPDIAWLTHASTDDDIATALADALDADDHDLQAQLEVVLRILAGRYARICPVDIAAIWPTIPNLTRRRPIRAALAAGEQLEAAGEIVRVLDFHRRPITVTRRVRGRDITAPIYMPTSKGETPWPAP